MPEMVDAAAVNRQAIAAAWAINQIGSRDWFNLCQRFIEQSYGTGGQYRSAAAAGQVLGINKDMAQADVGDLVFFRPDPSNGNAGHAAIYVGNGEMVGATNGGITRDKIFESPYWSKLFVGFGDPPEQWKGRPATEDLMKGAALLAGNAKSVAGNAAGAAKQWSTAAWGAAAPYAPQLMAAAAKHEVPVNVLAGLLIQESGGNPRAVSPAGAQGLMQFMPGTARGLGIDPFDPGQAIDAGARYLKQMADQSGGDWKQAVAKYNAGPAGNLNNAETRNHIVKVMGHATRIGDAMSQSGGLGALGGVAGTAAGGIGSPPGGGGRKRPDETEKEYQLRRKAAAAAAKQAGGLRLTPEERQAVEEWIGTQAGRVGGAVGGALGAVGAASQQQAGQAEQGVIQESASPLSHLLGVVDRLAPSVSGGAPGGTVGGSIAQGVPPGMPTGGLAGVNPAALRPATTSSTRTAAPVTPAGQPPGTLGPGTGDADRGIGATSPGLPGVGAPPPPYRPPVATGPGGRPQGWTDPSTMRSPIAKSIVGIANSYLEALQKAEADLAATPADDYERRTELQNTIAQARDGLERLAPTLRQLDADERALARGTVVSGDAAHMKKIPYVREKPDGSYELIYIDNPDALEHPSLTQQTRADEAAMERQTALLASQLGISREEAAAAMARLQVSEAGETGRSVLASNTQRVTAALSAAVQQESSRIAAQIRAGELTFQQGQEEYKQWYQQNVEAPLAILDRQQRAAEYGLAQQRAATERATGEAEHERGLANIGQQMFTGAATAYNQTLDRSVGAGWNQAFQSHLQGGAPNYPTLQVPESMDAYATRKVAEILQGVSPYADNILAAGQQLGANTNPMQTGAMTNLTNTAVGTAQGALDNPFQMPQVPDITLGPPVDVAGIAGIGAPDGAALTSQIQQGLPQYTP